MKNILLALNIVLTIAVGVLFYLHFSRPATNAGKTVQLPARVVQSADSSGALILYVNTDTLWTKYEYVIKERAALEKETKRLSAEWENRARALEKEAYEFEQKYQQGLVSQDDAQRKQQEFMQKQQQLMELKEKYSADLLKREQEKNQLLQDAISAFLKEYKMTTDVDYILGYSNGGNILFANDSLEITNEVLDGLNQRYREQARGK